MAGNSGGQDKPAFELYYSFAPQDEALCLELEIHLKPLERQNLVTCWHRGKLPPGEDVAQEVESHRQRANGILLLLSPDYVASDDCYAEMQWALERRQTKGLLVVPIILRPLEAEDIPFKTAQLLPTRGRPVTNWPSQDDAFQDILLGLRRILERDAPRESTSTPIWNVPYTHNPFFTGRENLLQQLHSNLTKNKVAALTQPYQQPSQQPQAISGLGGIGKTQTAVEYAYRHRDEYRFILWVNAATRDTIITSFLDLATLLKLPEREAQDQNLMIAAVKRWFTAHDAWLAIFDNADDLPIVEDFLPAGSRGHLLLTTRAHAPGTFANSLAVEQMDLQEAMLLLLRRARVLQPASPADRATATAIAQELDGLPLALDQAGAYIEETQCSLTSYLKQYRTRQAALLKRRGGTGKQHPEPVATTWSLSFEQVETLNPVAADLLRFLSFLAPDAIPEPLVRDGAFQLGPTLHPLATDESLLDEAIATLARYSLVKRKREDSTLTVHRLVQAVVKNGMDEQTQRQWAEFAVRAVDEAFPDVQDYRNWPRHQQFLPHALSCAALIDQWQLAFFEAGRLCNQVGLYLKDRAQYTEAETFYQRAIAFGEKALGPEHHHLAIYLNNLATVYDDQGKYEQAEPLYQRAIAIDEKTLDPEHPNLAIRFNNLANLYTNQGRYGEAEPLYQRAIAINEKVFGPTHHNTILFRENYAELLKQWKKGDGG